jgi:predicted ATP-grasp superfamily ATP-dependent carboligase
MQSTAPIPPPLEVLVLDGQYCHALAAVRSIGRRGAVVTVASHKPRAMAFASKHCAHRLACPSPVTDPVAYAAWLLATLRRGRYAVTLAFEEATADLLSQHRDQVQKWTGCPLPPREIFLAASRKDRVMRLARQIGVPTPETHELERFEDAVGLAPRLRYPVVVKGVHSSGGQQVEIARTPAQLVAVVERLTALRRDAALPLPIVQEYIAGKGYGVTALMRRGEPVAVFQHRRLAEHDVGRGTGLAHGAPGAQSVDEPELLQHGLTLLKALCWDGVAMVEFRRSRRDGRFYLMEINPRFVGSLELAIAAGIDLPWLYVQLAAGWPVVGPNRYRVGLRYRWLLSKNVADAFENPLRYAFGALSCLLPGTRCDLSLGDPAPHWSQLRNAVWWVREHLLRRRAPLPAAAGMPQPAGGCEPAGSVPVDASEAELVRAAR